MDLILELPALQGVLPVTPDFNQALANETTSTLVGNDIPPPKPK